MRPRSNGRGRPVTSARAARAGADGMRRLPASRLPVPPGMTPSATSVPTSAAAACIVVPSPPNTATTSIPCATPSAASRRASPGPVVASTSALQPAARRVPHDRVHRAGPGPRGGRVGDTEDPALELPLPQDVEADLVRVGGHPVGGHERAAGLDGRLHRALELPLAAEAELEARPQVLVAELAEVRAEAGVEGEERLAADLPAGRELREASRRRSGWWTRPDGSRSGRSARRGPGSARAPARWTARWRSRPGRSGARRPAPPRVASLAG